MGPGHFGVALAAKPLASKAPLWTLLVASETLDLLSFGFMAVGIEKAAVSQSNFVQGIRIIIPGSIPWSHGLFMSIIWSLVAAAIAWFILRDHRASAALGLVVLSHWILDFTVHLPDLPLFFDSSPKLGLGLWSTGPGLILSGILEIILLAGGIVTYVLWRKKRIEKEAVT
jgi:hypothetical protein